MRDLPQMERPRRSVKNTIEVAPLELAALIRAAAIGLIHENHSETAAKLNQSAKLLEDYSKFVRLLDKLEQLADQIVRKLDRSNDQPEGRTDA
jgi:hypothetical protein